ncbi:dipeptidase [Cytobacillus oceanisediminis]|jgi:membrane dipeptidase|uniref:dipeptidase n=1 Tax=Cytobacillus oceanisediminis TaxID=665099 RepID=UPI00203A5507|nr:dipeptidase [Cytobacillus oceanisediminis]MBY0157325.1 dipeptidase [Cytobacillus firmus]MCM3394305.1 dipeptidase [Cytobacillus oceanisediminis]
MKLYRKREEDSVKIFDAHCDVLYKMFLNREVDFKNSGSLQVNMEGLQASRFKVQCFAIYVPESVHPEMKFNAALYMADLFYDKVLKPSPQLKLIRSCRDIDLLQDDEIGAVLTLEGCDAVGCDLLKLKTLLRLGVSSVGLTWNYANCAADGVLEERGAGLSSFGKQVVYELNASKAWCDVSHLSERGFWDVIEWADYPFASHSNCYSLCPNPRNLSNEQIEALIDRDSVMGITFVTEFLSGKQSATITDILRHLEHVCSLGGENHVGFGSDFDGTDGRVTGLEDARKYDSLINELIKYYSDIQAENFLFRNFYSRFPR